MALIFGLINRNWYSQAECDASGKTSNDHCPCLGLTSLKIGYS